MDNHHKSQKQMKRKTYQKPHIEVLSILSDECQMIAVSRTTTPEESQTKEADLWMDEEEDLWKSQSHSLWDEVEQ